MAEVRAASGRFLIDQTAAEMRADGTAEAIIGRYLPDAAAYLEVDG